METHPPSRYLNSALSTSGSAENCIPREWRGWAGGRDGLGLRPSLRDVDRGRGVERGQAAQTVQTVRGRDKAGMGRGQVGA